jgi:hypothetical protein
MNPGMPKGKPLKLFRSVHARLAFLKREDERAVLELIRWFSSTTRYAYQRLLEGRDRKELKEKTGTSALSLAPIPLGLEAPQDLSPLKPILHLASLSLGSWKGWKNRLRPALEPLHPR